jgi:hypothetical protein
MELKEKDPRYYIMICILLGLCWLTILFADNYPWP